MAYYNLGNTLRDQKKSDEAINTYRKAIELNPNNVNVHYSLGCVLCDVRRDYHAAIECFRKAIELDPNHVNAHYSLGISIAKQGKQLDEAIAAFRKAIELDPKNANFHNNLGLALKQLAWRLATHVEPARRDAGRAVTLAKEAVELRPREGNSWRTLGAAQYRAGNSKAAIAALEKSMELRKGGDSNDWFFLAMAHWKLGEQDKAREWYDRAVEWMDKYQARNEELRRFRSEASEVLELKEKK